MQPTKNIMCGTADPVTNPVANAHKMPAAEQTLKVLWRSEGRQHFFAQAPDQVFGECAPFNPEEELPAAPGGPGH